MPVFKKSSIGVDIGNRSIKLVELEKSGDAIIVARAAIKEIPEDAGSDKEKMVYRLVSELFSELKIKDRNVNLSISGQSVFIRFVKLLHVKEERLKQTVRFEAQNQIPFALEEVFWDWSFIDKESGGASRKIIIAAVKKNLITRILTGLSSVNIKSDLIDIAPLCIYNCVSYNGDFSPGGLNVVIDIGARVTNLIIFKKGDIWVRSFPVAGDRLKEAGEQGAVELIGEIERSLEYYSLQSGSEQEEGRRPGEVILTGGGAMVSSFEARLHERLNVKTRFLDPFRKLNISKNTELKEAPAAFKNRLGVATGLALRGLATTDIEINFLSETITESRLKREKSLYARLSIIMAALVVISASLFMRQDYAVKRAKIDKLDNILELYNQYEPKIKRIEDEKKALKEKIDTLYRTAAMRAIWLDALRVISGILPNEVWITDFSGMVSFEGTGAARLDLTGKALSYKGVNDFISKLKAEPLFRHVKPISSSVISDEKSGEEIVRFSITMDVVPEDTDV